MYSLAPVPDVILDAAPAIVDTMPVEGSQFDIALRRLQEDTCPVDPQASVARFSSAF